MIEELIKNKKKKPLRKIVPVVTKKYNVRFKNSDQTILL